MIDNTNLTRVRMLNFYQIMDNVITYLNQEDLETLKLKDPVKVFTDKFNDFDKLIQPMRSSGLSKDLYELDDRRDRAMGRLSTHLRLFSDYPEADKAKAAKELLQIYRKYGSLPQNKPNREETALIKNLLQDFEPADIKAKLALIGADKWVSVLKEANDAFSAMYGRQVKHESMLDPGAVKEKRDAVYDEFKKLTNVINALATLGGEAAYKSIIDMINTEMKKAVLAERPETKKPSDPKQPKTPKEPKEPKQPKAPKQPEQPKDPKQPETPQPPKPGGEKPKPGGDGNPDITLPEE
jgi:ORF34